ncbi:endonuclease III domain-containing protein [Thermocrinis minervae]|uniref:Endonuclease III n=1 Tax=Thermocrinis minervae TaxID=381751 RepID=A0A1M6SJ99_9AQUI|nr:endonuclease III [Thermocrinis minervae]SHK44821.1 endonuclease-3 [Thermocrinis minervae]
MRKEEIHKLVEILKEEFPKWKAPIVSLLAYKTKSPFCTLVCALLSTRTRDETTAQVCEKFTQKVKSPQDILNMPLEELERLIYPVGFYRNKARQLKELARQLIDNYSGKVPDSLEELLKLKGVGRKVANLVLAEGYQRPAICVDTHVHRISNRLGIVKTKDPYQTEIELMKVLPVEYWRDFNKLLVAFGQTICKPTKPKCEECPVRDLCEYYKSKSL